MAKKDKKVIKVKTATVGKSFGTKKVDSDIEFLKTKLLKGKKGETVSDIGADILKRNKDNQPVEDDGLSDMARMILANKNKKEVIEEETEIIEEETEIIEEETENESVIEEEEIIEDIEPEDDDEPEVEVEDEIDDDDEHLLGWVSCMRGKIVRHYGPEVEACVNSITHSNSNWTAILKCIVSVKGISNPEIWIPEQLVLFTLWAGECFFSEEELEEELIEELIEEVEEELEELEEEIKKVIIDIVPEIVPEIKPEPEVIEEPEVKTEIIIQGTKTDVRNFEVGSEENSTFQVYNYVDTHVYVRIFEKLENKSSFRLHIPKSTPRFQFYVDITSSDFLIYHKNNILFDFYSYSGYIDFTIQGMLFNGKLYPFQALEFVKM